MREETLRRLREISPSLSATKTGATGATGRVSLGRSTLLHRPCRVSAPKITERIQACSTVAPVSPQKQEGGGIRSTGARATGGATAHSESVQQVRRADPVALEDWLAAFDERAATLEFDGGHGRVAAERFALTETEAALGKRPVQASKGEE
ncbi:hypothetical protein QA634_04065 [Methylobacterium sp. CB376]|uniref:hypothetical protein n=1 Tax=unclassified Methylobacterium TaxID=2615210 RepID=UPI0012370F60|nr:MULTISPECIES: hypothetical protein [Methylobacterium]WFT81087.1 hypothetical protein QA634_04065 [Methylobacterium nodulans]